MLEVVKVCGESRVLPRQ